jgi:glycosyltransferase involved in cell wall biosynthesis
MPLVRVVIPTYNRAALVAEALESVLAQTFSAYEVVVADDGSTDDTLSVLKQLSIRDGRVRFVALAHAGAARARNAAVKEPGQYRYVAFLDSDDLWPPCHLEQAVETLEREQSVALFFGRFLRSALIGSEAESTQEPKPVRNPLGRATRTFEKDRYLLSDVDCLQAMLLSEFAPHTSTVVVRPDAVKRAEWFNPKLEVYEDLDFFLRLALDGCNFAYHDVTHCYRRRFGDNLTELKDLSSPILLRRYHSVARYSQIKLSICRSSEQRNSVVQEIAQAFFIIGECSREQSDLRKSRVAYWKSLRYHWSAHALRGFLLSLLPYPMYSVLRNVKTSLRAATLQ